MSIHTVNLNEAEGHLAELAELAAQGKDVQVALGNGRVMKLVIESAQKIQRVVGLHEGQGWMSDDFNDPLDSLFGLGDKP
ncbi:MAG: hypothetical protein V3T17_12275 [Pseudomonadales bacterium]